MKTGLIITIIASMLMSFKAIAGGDEVVVIVKNYQFIPPQVTIKKGQTIRWQNQENRQYHSVWFEALDEEEPDYIFPEESYQRTFVNTGDFPYRCGPHPKMLGKVIVTD